MSVKPFRPQYMKIGVLTAALQELTPREVRDPDPDKAIEEWVAFARELGADHIQLSAALRYHYYKTNDVKGTLATHLTKMSVADLIWVVCAPVPEVSVWVLA